MHIRGKRLKGNDDEDIMGGGKENFVTKSKLPAFYELHFADYVLRGKSEREGESNGVAAGNTK